MIELDEKIKADLRADVAEVIKDAESMEEQGNTVSKVPKALKRIAGILDELIKNA